MEQQRGPGRPRKVNPPDQQNGKEVRECCETCYSHRENKSTSLFVKGQVICHYFPQSIPRNRDHWCRQWESQSVSQAESAG